jgi:hypothetical protein
VIAGHRHDALAQVRQQRQARVAVGLRVVARDDVGAPEPVEAQVPALRRQAVEERLDVGFVVRLR